MNLTRKQIFAASCLLGCLTCLSCSSDDGPSGPSNPGTPPKTQLGNAGNGQQVFRFETFGNEGFWTDAVRLPQGMMDKGTTPLQALRLGISFDSDAIDASSKQVLAAQLQADPTGQKSALLNDPNFVVTLFNENAVIGFPVKDTAHLGHLDITNGSKVGASCAMCHSNTDASLLNVTNGGGIGRRQDGRAAHTLDFGSIVALARNPLAYFPQLQVVLGGKTLGRAMTGLDVTSSEADAVAYLTNKAYYPVGMFDDTPDGGQPMHNMPLFRQDLSAPYGSAGEISTEDNFANQVYVALLDPTMLTTTGGRAFEHKVGGALGDELVAKYVQILAKTGVTGYPYVKAAPPSDPSLAGTEGYNLGVRVDDQELADMNAYVFGLQAPAGVVTDAAAVSRGQHLFRTKGGCTSCHNVDQSVYVPTNIIPMKQIFPGDNPTVVAQRQAPLTPIEYTPDATFDTKMATINASLRGLERGIALPLLLDLARKPVFLHDNSVGTLDDLLSPSRGSQAPHPFYLSDSGDRSDVVQFLKSLGTTTTTARLSAPRKRATFGVALADTSRLRRYLEVASLPSTVVPEYRTHIDAKGVWH